MSLAKKKNVTIIFKVNNVNTPENEAHGDMEQNCFLFFPEYIQKNTNSLSKVAYTPEK